MKQIFVHFAASLFLLTVVLSVPAEENPDPGYKVGIDDILDISVIQPERMAVTVTVSPDGTVTFPYIGSILAKEKTLSQIQDAVQAKLADGYMVYPVVSVSLREVRSKKIYVYGEVVKPGTYLITDKNTTVMKAITMAGGFAKEGTSNKVKVLRTLEDGNKINTLEVDIKSAMKGSSEADIMLQPGDTVTVTGEKYFVYGEVNRPGSYPLEENTTVVKSILIAEGFSKFGSSSRVKILRPEKGGQGCRTLKVNLKAALDGDFNEDIPLECGDTVVISEGVF